MAAEHLQGSVLSIILVVEVLMVFIYSAKTKMEQATIKRFAGVAIGLIGVSLAVYTQENNSLPGTWVWALLALSIPLGYAIVDILIVRSKQIEMLPTTTLGLASLAGLVIMIPIAWLQGGFVSFGVLQGKLAIWLLVISILTVVSMLVLVKLINSAGAVFGSQAAYVMTLAGIVWSIVLLGEAIAAQTWWALVITCIGLILVEPKREAEEELSEAALAILRGE